MQATATEQDRKLLSRINGPAEERYDTPIRMRGFLLYRVWRWADRVGASEVETDRVVDSLGLRSSEVEQIAMEYMSRNL